MVTDTFWPRINGVSTSVSTLTHALRELGHEVYIVAPDYSRLPTRRTFIEGERVAADNVIRFPAHPLLFFPEDCSINLTSRDFWRKTVHLRRMEFDVIHTHTPLKLGIASMYWRRDRRATLIHTFHTLFEEFIPVYFPFCYLPRSFTRRFAHWFSLNALHWYCNHFDAIIAPSRQVAELLHTYQIRPPVHVIPTGIETDRFRRGDRSRLREEWGIAPEERVLLFAGRVGYEKGIDLILRSLPLIRERVPVARMVIVGRGPAEGALKKMARRLGIASWVRFTGYKPHAEMPDVYAAADLFLFASRTETQGLVTVEAMAAGRPVVAVAGPGTLDVLHGERGGLLCPPDQVAFANCVVRLLTDDALYARKVTEALRRAEEFSARNMARRVLALYESARGRSSSSDFTQANLRRRALG